MSLMVSVELESFVSCRPWGVELMRLLTVRFPNYLGGVEVLDEAVPEVEGVVEGDVCAVLGAEDCVLGVADGVVGAVALSESVGSADPPGACGAITALATAEPVAKASAFADSAASLAVDSISAAFAAAFGSHSPWHCSRGCRLFFYIFCATMTRDSVVFLRLKSLVAAFVSNSSLRPWPGVRLGRSSVPLKVPSSLASIFQ